MFTRRVGRPRLISHDGDLFIYVASGEFEVTTEQTGTMAYVDGQALRMNSMINMEARNVSDTENLKLVIFQVGKEGDPFLIAIE